MAVQDSLLPHFHRKIKQSFISSFLLYEITQLLPSKEEPCTICYEKKPHAISTEYASNFWKVSYKHLLQLLYGERSADP